jgi:hypothetical protein
MGRSCDWFGRASRVLRGGDLRGREVRSAGRVPATPEGVTTLAASLLSSDRVALEVTGSCWEVARILEPHVNRVVVVSPDDTGISSARAKTDKLDARALASLLWRGELEAVWMPTSAVGSCAGDSRVVSSWCTPAAGSRTRSTRCCSAGCRASRRALTCSGSRAASGWRGWSYRWRSASPSTLASVRSSFSTRRSRRSRS